MPRMKILNSMESESFDKPPKLNSIERKKYLSFPKEYLSMQLKFAQKQIKCVFS